MSRWIALAALSAAATLTPQARAEQTLESVEQEIVKHWHEINSYTADMVIKFSMSMGPASVNTNGTGNIEFMKIEEQPRYRMEMVNTIGTNIPLMKEAGAIESLTVFDGQTVYTENKGLGKHEVQKMVPKDLDNPKNNPFSGQQLIDSLHKKGPVELLANETVDGVECYVLQVTPDPKKETVKIPVKIEKVKVYVAKETGLQKQLVMINQDGTPFMTTTYTDIKINPTLDPARFTYTPPPGIEVKEVTKQSFGQSPF